MIVMAYAPFNLDWFGDLSEFAFFAPASAGAFLIYDSVSVKLPHYLLQHFYKKSPEIFSGLFL